MRIAVLALVVASPASAAVTVQSTGVAYPTLSAAIAAAVAGDTLTMDPGTYTEHVVVDRDLTIVGNAPVTLTYSGPEAEVMRLPANVDVTLTGLTFRSADSRGITAEDNNLLTLGDVVFDGTTSTGDGGGLSAWQPARLTLTDVDFLATSAVNGGGLSVSSLLYSPVELTNVDFLATSASNNGGAIHTSVVSLSCMGCTFRSSSADYGGAIYDGDASDVTVTDSTFEATTASIAGGAIDAHGGGTLLVMRSTFCRTSASYGGAISGIVALGWVINSWFVETAAASGGGLFGSGTTWTVDHNTFAGVTGSAVSLVDAGTSGTVSNTLFLDGSGFGIDVAGGATTTADFNAFWGNAGDISGATLGSYNLTTVDPQLEAWSQDGDCNDDSLVPTFGSPLVDAGDWSWTFDDPDGSRSDIGATGGPDADPHADADSDGYSVYRDCDDGDPDAATLRNAWRDLDSDGYGDIAQPLLDSCGIPAGYTTNDDDCDDTSALVGPPQDFEPDLDGDGWGAGSSMWVCEAPEGYGPHGDCDDGDPTVWQEVAGCIDADLDGLGAIRTWDEYCVGDLTPVDNCIDCDDSDPLEGDSPWWPDPDLDGFAATDLIAHNYCGTTPPEGWVQQLGDCRPLDPTAFPGAPELCDEIDRDCDGDLSDAPGWQPFWHDGDGDGFGDPDFSISYCEPRDGWVDNDLDCADRIPDAHPGAPDVCNGEDDDCNGLVDDGPPQVWYLDSDGDGVGGSGRLEQACAPGPEWLQTTGDCDDQDAAISPLAEERCNGVDDDCDGVIDADDCPAEEPRNKRDRDAGCGCSVAATPAGLADPRADPRLVWIRALSRR